MKTWERTEEIHGQHQPVDKNDSASKDGGERSNMI